jgi:hypothetical protein
MFGTLLTWMQEHTEPVFLIATANDIEALPPELLRKGRFDEIFFVDLPADDARRTIFAIHLKKRKRDPKQFDLDASPTHRTVTAARKSNRRSCPRCNNAFARREELTTELIVETLKNSPPLSVTMAEKGRGDCGRGRRDAAFPRTNLIPLPEYRERDYAAFASRPARRLGQVNRKRRPAPHLATHFDPSLVVLDDLAGRCRNPRPRALGLALLARVLGGEERVENLADHRRAMPAPVSITWIFHLRAVFTARLDRQRAAFAEHRLPRVDQEVQQDLLELDGVAFHAQIGLHLHAQRDAVLLRLPRQHLRTSSTICCTDTRPNDDLPARQRQHRRADFSRLASSDANAFANALRISGMSGSSLSALLSAYWRVEQNRREQVVELVRDDRRDRADRRQPLRFR